MVLMVPGIAWAHVVVSPKEAPANSYQKLTVSVPTEQDIPTTEVRVEVPEGFTVTGVQPVPGWQHEFEKDSGVIKTITWSGGKINPEEFQEFALQARTPKDSGEFPWKAYQTYEDSSVVEWTGPPDAEEPASVVRIASGGSTTDEHDTGKTDTHSEGTAGPTSDTLPESGGPAVQSTVAYAALGLGALVLAAVAFLALRWRHD
jgi:uncharacterized protein YcnI